MIRAIKMILLCIIGIGGYFQCSMLPSIAGNSSSETTNGYIVGSLIKNDGSYAMNARVMLVPNNFNPVKDGPVPDSLTDTTNEAGKFIFRVPAEGIYDVEALNPATGDRAFISNISVFGHDTVFAPTATIQRPGAIKALQPTSSAAAYVYLPGTTRFGRVVGSSAIIDSVPAGSFTALCYVNQTDTTQDHSKKINFTVTSACTTFITANHAWNFSKNLYINTTLSGAAVSSNVYSFPVLVRLLAGNFVFSQPKSGGEDVRFVKADGSALPFEIERWDPTIQQAEIWVKVDTVYGNDSTHFFTMLWGDSLSTDSSKSAAVFDTASGFQGVWHLAEPGNSTPGGYRDATINAYNLSGTNRSAASGAEGMIGGAQSFDTIPADSITGPCPAKLKGNASFTASFWVKTNSLKPTRPCILDFGVDTYLAGAHFFIWPDYTTQFGMFDTGTFTPPNGPEPVHQNSFAIGSYAATWMQIVMVYNAGDGTLSSYVNGTLVEQKTISAIQIKPSGGLHIGRPYTDYYPGYFIGQVDEVRLLSVPASQDWIKLDYENQRKGGMLVRFY